MLYRDLKQQIRPDRLRDVDTWAAIQRPVNRNYGNNVSKSNITTGGKGFSTLLQRNTRQLLQLHTKHT